MAAEPRRVDRSVDIEVAVSTRQSSYPAAQCVRNDWQMRFCSAVDDTVKGQHRRSDAAIKRLRPAAPR